MDRTSWDDSSGQTSKYSINPASQTSSYSGKPTRNQNSSHSNKARDTVFTPEFREDLAHWIKNHVKTASKVLELVEAVERDPFKGLGKPENLKHLKNVWSRHITEEHRLVYLVSDSRVDFLQARYHY